MPKEDLKLPSFDSRTSIPLVSELDKEEKGALYQKLGIYEKGFTVGVLSFSTNLVFLSRWPQYFWLWHLAKGFVFIPWRLVRFRRRNWEWYLLDFCYFVTFFTMLGCLHAFLRITTGITTFAAAYNYHGLRAGFGFANGALVMAVPLFGNKIVFHDVDNTASLYIHLSPALFFWTLRWGGGYGTSLIEQTWPEMFHICHDMHEADISVNDIPSAFWYSGPCAGAITEFALYPGILWIVMWGIPYYLIVFCCFKSYLAEHPEKAYLYKDFLKDTELKGRFINMLPASLQPLGFMSTHLLWTIVAGFASIILWNSFVLHTVFLMTIFLYALHNGSTYMFRIVAARNVQGIVQKASNTPKGAAYKPVEDFTTDGETPA